MSKKQFPTFLITFLLTVLLQFQSEIVLSQSTFKFFEEDGKVGLKNNVAEVIIPANYEALGWTEGLNVPVNDVLGYKKKHWGLISTKNKIISSPRYYSLEAFHKNLIIASVKGKFSNELFFGVLNFKGEVAVDFKYHSIKPLQDLLIISERKKGRSNYGLISQKGKTLLPTNFKDIEYFKDELFVFTNWNGQKGIIHKNGIVKLEATLDSIAPAAETYSLIIQSGKVGAIDSAGNLLYKPQFKSISNLDQIDSFGKHQIFDAQHKLLKNFYCDSIFGISSDFLVVKRNDYYEILNSDYEQIFKGKQLKNLTAFRKNIVFKTNNSYHIIKYNGDPVVEDGFDTLLFDTNYMYGKSKKHWDVFNKFGSNISSLNFDSILTNSNNLIPVKRNDYWGYIDHSGKLSISAKYDAVGQFIGNLAAVNYLGSKRLINQFGEFIGESEFNHVNITHDNTALVNKRGRTDLINYRGKVLFQTFNQMSDYPFGFLEKTAEGKVGLISKHGEVLLYPEYDSISNPKNIRYAVVYQGDQVGLINDRGFWIIPLSIEIQEICHVSEGFISIKKNGQYGFLDFGQRLLIANRYDNAQPFKSDLAAISLNDKWGFIDKKEQLIIQPTFNKVTDFKNGISIVQRDGKYGVIDQTGKEKIKIEFDSFSTTTHDFLLAQKEGKLGLFNQFGELLLQPSYTDIQPTKDDHFIVERRKKYGLIDSSGRYSIPLKYSYIKEISYGRYICLEKSGSELK